MSSSGGWKILTKGVFNTLANEAKFEPTKLSIQNSNQQCIYFLQFTSTEDGKPKSYGPIVAEMGRLKKFRQNGALFIQILTLSSSIAGRTINLRASCKTLKITSISIFRFFELTDSKIN